MACCCRSASENILPEEVGNDLHAVPFVPSDMDTMHTAADEAKSIELEDIHGATSRELPSERALASGSVEHSAGRRRKAPSDQYKGMTLASNYDLGVKFSYMQIVSMDEDTDAWEPASAALIRIMTDAAQARLRDFKSFDPNSRCVPVVCVC